MRKRPLLLDLFAGQGGAAVGYHRAGFDVIGVDIVKQPRYPFPMVVADALQPPFDLAMFDAIHASPPCQAYSDLAAFAGKKHAKLIDPVRAMLRSSGRPYVIENVEGAPLDTCIVLCGSMFGLGAECNDGKRHQLRRHRLFECSFFFLVQPCSHVGKPVGVYGNGGGNKDRVEAGLVNGMTGTSQERKDAMGINWMTRCGLSQAIPPAYTEFVGKRLMEIICKSAS